MTQSTIDSFGKVSGVKRQITDRELLAIAKKHGGPATRLLVKCYTEDKTIKGKKKIILRKGNRHFMDLLRWRYEHNKIEV